MRAWPIAVAALACLVMAGCRTDPTITLLERELRLQEDEIYRLNDCLEDQRAALKECREQQAGSSDPWKTGDAEPSRGPDFPIGPGAFVPPKVDIPSESMEERERTEAPRAPGAYDVPNGVPSPPDLAPPGRLPSEEGDRKDGSESSGDFGTRRSGAAGPVVRTDSSQVIRLALNNRLTGGYDADGRPGDEGVVVVVELHDARGRQVEAPADVSAVIYDTAQVDPGLDDPVSVRRAALVGRWDFASVETTRLFGSAGPDRGMQLQLPWPANPPAHGMLDLFVRYTTSDGRRLEAHSPVLVALPGELSHRWEPAGPSLESRPAARLASFEAPDGAERRQERSRSQTQPPGVPAAAPAAEPTGSSLERPVWSPERP